MPYAQNETAPAASTLSEDSARMIDRLQEILGRTIKIGSCLHGSQPRDAGGGKSPPEPEPTIRRNIDRTHQLLGDIEGELSRIEGRL